MNEQREESIEKLKDLIEGIDFAMLTGFAQKFKEKGS
jgi:hypothetical protein